MRPILLLFIATLTLGSCGAATDAVETEPIRITGTVLDLVTGTPVADAVVRITSPAPVRFEVTDANGAFEFQLPVDSLVNVSISAVKEGYSESVQTAFGVPGRDITLPPFRLSVPGSGGGGGGDGGSGGPTTSVGRVWSISLETVSHPQLQVAGTGGREQSLLTFVLRDSVGNVLSIDRATDVSFRFGATPGGGTQLSSSTARSDGTGRVRANVTSGTASGVVQVIAEAEREPGVTVQSQPVNLVIQAGLPEPGHFSIASERKNLPGCALYGVTSAITAYVGDRYGNPVPDGTAVYFTTTGGLITGSGQSTTGVAGATLMTAAPCPASGFATVTASTGSETGTTITAQHLVMFSGETQFSIDQNTVNIPNGGSQTFTYTVQDANGHPLTPGSSYKVTVEGEGVTAVGDVDVTMPDTWATGPGATQFTFTVSDADATTNQEQVVSITIDVASPNGSLKATFGGSSFKIVRKPNP